MTEVECTLNLDEIDSAIKHLMALKAQRMRDKIAAHHHLEGETNSKYNYALNRLKAPWDTIMSLQTNLGESPATYTSDSKQMAETATGFYDTLQTVDMPAISPETLQKRMDEVLSKLPSRVNGANKAKLSIRISEDEVRQALKEVPNDKAAGLDGIPIEIWKLFESKRRHSASRNRPSFDVVQIMTMVFNDIERHGVANGTGFAEGWLCPLYKKKDKTNIGNYRPITILNTDYKVFTKALTNRLAKVAPSLINSDQAGFMKGQLITDQTELIQNVIARCEAEDKHSAIVCLDQEKAYDRVNHNFLWASLTKLSFPETFVATIRNLYETAQTRVILNGVIGPKYDIKRGVRQGDPLSCLLFNIVIESLAEAV
jgi:Reverse transcriptase (RNA-dependent DNA polymerase)